ncbi:MAG: 3-isopropylmalate dehydratase small subunit [Thermoanaerobaculia bacterium]
MTRRPLTFVESPVATLREPDIDTDQIIPAAYLKGTSREGLGVGLFAQWRFDPAGRPQPDFALNRPEAEAAEILLAGPNFGCGSSREHAVWALADFGFRVVISSRFADIFQSNAQKNGLLPLELPETEVAALAAELEPEPAALVTVDIQACRLRTPAGRELAFNLDPFVRRCLLEGRDPLDFLLAQEEAIQAFEVAHPARFDSRELGEEARP